MSTTSIGKLITVVWNDKFPPLNLWNYPNYMNDKAMSLAGLDPATEKKLAWIREQEAKNCAVKATSGINEIQYGGSHYKNKAIQPWDYVVANNLGYLEGSIIKYVSRWKDKNGVEDLLKARHFLDKLIEVQSAKG